MSIGKQDLQELAQGLGEYRQEYAMDLATREAMMGDPSRLNTLLQEQRRVKAETEEELKRKQFDEFVEGLSEGSFKNLAKALGPEKIETLLLEQYKRELPKEMTISDYKAYLANKIARGEELSPEDLQLEAFLANLDPFERRTRGIPPRTTQGKKETSNVSQLPDVSKLSPEEIKATYPKGTILMYQGTEIIVD